MGEHKSLEAFMQDVKQGYTRGDSVREQIVEDVFVELSVADFQDGYIHFRIFIDDEQVLNRVPIEEGTYYRRLYAIDDDDDVYAAIHKEVSERIEAEVEAASGNAHEWEIRKPETREDYPFLPDELNGETTVAFEEHIRLRDDVTMIEAMETNRPPENTPQEYERD